MEKLKAKLFEETFYYQKRYNFYKKELGEFDRLTSVEYGQFIALYNLIEECGLENEYQEWKGQQK